MYVVDALDIFLLFSGFYSSYYHGNRASFFSDFGFPATCYWLIMTTEILATLLVFIPRAVFFILFLINRTEVVRMIRYFKVRLYTAMVFTVIQTVGNILFLAYNREVAFFESSSTGTIIVMALATWIGLILYELYTLQVIAWYIIWLLTKGMPEERERCLKI